MKNFQVLEKVRNRRDSAQSQAFIGDISIYQRGQYFPPGCEGFGGDGQKYFGKIEPSLAKIAQLLTPSKFPLNST